ncbi:hypothetical protein IV203_038526 [Nitzschia inconspicua]|uniref:Uncharacterized protein n=1 Tax=Nitzschia inconspicua TaxID=303405 RepID=A0A9K3PZB9_9STRA|nr:hypothetical protein IV203_038526 [Nitzschia inconspicua]
MTKAMDANVTDITATRRPWKRPRFGLCEDSQSFHRNLAVMPLQQNGSQLTRLLDELVKGHHEDSRVFVSTLSQISWYMKSSRPIDTEEVVTVHGMLLLQIGFHWGSLKHSPSHGNGSHQAILCSLLGCLRAIYLQDSIFQTRILPDNLQVFNETLDLIPTLILELHSMILRDKVDIGAEKSVFNESFQLLRSFVLMSGVAHSMQRTDPRKLRRLLLSIVACVRHISDETTVEQSMQLLKVLETLSETKSSFRLQGELARDLFTGNVSVIEKHDVLSVFDRLFLWECLAVVGKVVIPKYIADMATIQIIFRCADLSKGCVGLSMDVSIFLRFFLPLASVDCAKEVLDGICGRLDSINLSNFDQCDQRDIEALDAIMMREDGPQLLLQHQHSKQVLQIVTAVASKSVQATTLSETAANIVSCALKHSLSLDETALSMDVTLNVATTLLSSCASLPVLEVGIDVVHRTKVERDLSCTTMRNCACALVSVAISNGEYLSIDAKEKLVESFLKLVTDSKQMHTLARQPSILGFLVQIIAGTAVSAPRANTHVHYRATAVMVVMEMAKNPCNQRILAKTTGLVSSLIRFTRSVQQGEHVNIDNDRNNSRHISRDELKRQIFLLAEAL